MHHKIPIDTTAATAAAVHDGILTTINHGGRNNKWHRNIKISFYPFLRHKIPSFSLMMGP